jgi:hypothetical protein
MYFIVLISTGEIVHTNPAPPHQGLRAEHEDPLKRIWADYDPAIHRAVEHDGQLPEHHDLVEPSASGENWTVAPWDLERRVLEGVEAIDPNYRAVGDELIEKTRAEKIADGVLTIGMIRAEKIAAVEARGSEIAARGMIYSGRTFEASSRAKRYLTSLIDTPRPQGWTKIWYTLQYTDDMTLDEPGLVPFRNAMVDHLEELNTSVHEQIALIRRETDINALEAEDHAAGVIVPATAGPGA